MSKYYGALDGYTFCSESYDLVVSTDADTQPLWLDVAGNYVTVTTSTEIDNEDAVLVTVTASRDGEI